MWVTIRNIKITVTRRYLRYIDFFVTFGNVIFNTILEVSLDRGPAGLGSDSVNQLNFHYIKAKLASNQPCVIIRAGILFFGKSLTA